MNQEFTTIARNLSFNPPFDSQNIIAPIVLTCILFCIGIGLNLLTIIAIIKYKVLWTPFLLMVLSISISDCLLSLISPMFFYVNVFAYNNWGLSSILCQVYWGVYLTLICSKASHITCLVFLRYIYCARSDKIPLSRSRVQFFSWILWFFSIVVSSVPVYFLFDATESHDRIIFTPHCAIAGGEKSAFVVFIRFASLFLGALILLVGIFVFLLWRQIRRRRRYLSNLRTATDQYCKKDSGKMHRLLMISTCFQVTYACLIAYTMWTSMILSTTSSGSFQNTSLHYWIGIVMFFILRFGECLNPILHFLGTKNLRTFITKLVSC